MISSTVTIALANKGNLSGGGASEADRLIVTSTEAPIGLAANPCFLRIPPFPGAALTSFVQSAQVPVDAGALADKLRRLRVGGSYWAAQPELGDEYVLATSAAAAEHAKLIASGKAVVLWDRSGKPRQRPGVTVIAGECDPWHMLARAVALVGEADGDLRLVAALLGVDRYECDVAGGCWKLVASDASDLIERSLSGTAFENPFTGEPMDVFQAADLCGFWRALIDSNRGIGGGLGFAFWKQRHVGPLLWDGGAPFRFHRAAVGLRANAALAVWRVKAPVDAISALERAGVPMIEVEDGFLRSSGLGADCIPPSSITVDRLGAHFDPAQPSELELLLQEGGFEADLLARARELRQLIVEAGLGKYGQGTELLDRPAGERRHILVPGQVEDDRAVQAGGCGLTSNLELLRRVREQAPDAYILYKPHPDVLAGHRRGNIADRDCLRFADQVVADAPIAPLLAMVDEVHVNTSLAGFEALLRGKAVTTYGVPFYAGWGLTTDLGAVPARRTATRSLDELVAATLLLYPRYLDPVTGLPCPAEVLVSRLSACQPRRAGMIVGVRRLQGKLLRRLRSVAQ